MTDPNFKPFSEYRHKDYVIPRSMKEAYGHEPVLYTDEPTLIIFVDRPVALVVVCVVVLLSVAVVAAVLF